MGWGEGGQGWGWAFRQSEQVRLASGHPGQYASCWGVLCMVHNSFIVIILDWSRFRLPYLSAGLSQLAY